MKVLIVDDEDLARVEMRRLLSMHADVEVVGESAGVKRALELTATHSPDVVFLDIHLAGESGFDYVAAVSGTGIRIVFVTAYDRYALRAFGCNALDYLLKPVEPERLAETLRRLSVGQRALGKRAADNDMVFLQGPAVARFVPWREVSYITSDGNNTKIVLAGGVVRMARPLKDWLELMPSGLFFQTHRTAIVRLDMIREVFALGERRQVRLADGAVLPVSRTCWPSLKTTLERSADG